MPKWPVGRGGNLSRCTFRLHLVVGVMILGRLTEERRARDVKMEFSFGRTPAVYFPQHSQSVSKPRWRLTAWKHILVSYGIHKQWIRLLWFSSTVSRSVRRLAELQHHLFRCLIIIIALLCPLCFFFFYSGETSSNILDVINLLVVVLSVLQHFKAAHF